MPMTTDEVSNLLSHLASVDAFHATQSQEKFATKVNAWHDILKELDYAHCVRAITTHYGSVNAKSITPGQLRALAVQAAPRPPSATSGSPDDIARRERACSSPACRCTHLECFNGFLDEEVTVVRNGRSYQAVRRCPICTSALEARVGVEVG